MGRLRGRATNGTGTVEAIHLASDSGGEPESIETVEAVASRGLRGDRHFAGDVDGQSPSARGTPSRAGFDLTLIEAEALEAAESEGLSLFGGRHRRNVTTSDAALNHLVGERFRVGDVVCEGVELCEPCGHLESLTEDGAVSTLLHRGGLCAEIVESGTVEVGDELEAV